MTDAPGQFMLPVDESPPKERLSRPMLLAVGAAAVLIHLALLTVFTPLKPEPAGRPDYAVRFFPRYGFRPGLSEDGRYV